MNLVDHATLAQTALRVREHVIRMSTDGGCFIGASLSCADILVHLYSTVLNVSPSTLADRDRDYLFLSKGHDVPALYGVLAELGFLAPERLARHLKTDDDIYWHPNRAVPGVEFHSGSLGHLLSVAIGVALDVRIDDGPNRIFVVIGDGELNEGSIWEGLLVAGAHRLDNICVVVDRNGFQANIETESLIPLEPLEEKFAAFGCAVTRIDGHSFEAMDAAFSTLPIERGRVSVVIADTVRGRGCASIERRADRWFVNFTTDEVAGLLAELHDTGVADLTSQPLMVR